MNDAITILTDEKIRLENLNEYARQKLIAASSIALVQKSVKDQNGEKRLASYIDLDMFTPEQRQKFDVARNKYIEMSARLCVFDNYIKSMVPQSTIQFYNQEVTPLEEFKDVIIPCSCIELDDNIEFTKSSIRVGPYNIESPREMPFEQYAQLYTNSLSKVLINSLGNSLTQEQLMQEMSMICSEIYLNSPHVQQQDELNPEMSK